MSSDANGPDGQIPFSVPGSSRRFFPHLPLFCRKSHFPGRGGRAGVGGYLDAESPRMGLGEF